MLLVVCQLSRDFTHLAMKTRNQSIVTVKQSSIVSQIVSSPVVLSQLVLLDLVYKSFVRRW